MRAYCWVCQDYCAVTQDEDGVLWCNNCGSEIFDENLMEKIRRVNDGQGETYQIRIGQDRRQK